MHELVTLPNGREILKADKIDMMRVKGMSESFCYGCGASLYFYKRTKDDDEYLICLQCGSLE